MAKKTGKVYEFKGTMEERILAEMERIHQYLSCDYHTLQDEDGPVTELTGEDIQDLVGDRMHDSTPYFERSDSEARKAFVALDTKEQEQLLEKAFPAKRRYEV